MHWLPAYLALGAVVGVLAGLLGVGGGLLMVPVLSFRLPGERLSDRRSAEARAGHRHRHHPGDLGGQHLGPSPAPRGALGPRALSGAGHVRRHAHWLAARRQRESTSAALHLHRVRVSAGLTHARRDARGRVAAVARSPQTRRDRRRHRHTLELCRDRRRGADGALSHAPRGHHASGDRHFRDARLAGVAGRHHRLCARGLGPRGCRNPVLVTCICQRGPASSSPPSQPPRSVRGSPIALPRLCCAGSSPCC